MYRVEQFTNKTDMKNFLENYVDVKKFLGYCEQCEEYGTIWSCPPYDFDPEECWKKYKYIYLIGTKIIFERNFAEKERNKEEISKLLGWIFAKEKKILLDTVHALEKEYSGGAGLSAGGCDICGKCTRLEGKPCLFPEKMRHSIESLGGNVVKTAADFLGVELLWMDGKLPEYLTLVNGFLTDDPDVEIICESGRTVSDEGSSQK